MVIDLQRCVGCGACAFACKSENNTRTRGDGQSFNWADFVMKTEGTFPNVTHWVMPVLCNHCSDAPCVKICPTEPKAMFKTPEGVTMHDTTLCIGCRRCQPARTAAANWVPSPQRRDLRHQLQPRGRPGRSGWEPMPHRGLRRAGRCRQGVRCGHPT
jgi:Fe-S-cluster-containing dehydrogenase component